MVIASYLPPIAIGMYTGESLQIKCWASVADNDSPCIVLRVTLEFMFTCPREQSLEKLMLGRQFSNQALMHLPTFLKRDIQVSVPG